MSPTGRILDDRFFRLRITLLNYALPEPDPQGSGIRWWHKSGSRWPATVRDRRTDGSEYFPWPFLLSYAMSMLAEGGHSVELVDACVDKLNLGEVVTAVRLTRPEIIVFETSEQTEHTDPLVLAELAPIAPLVLIGPNVVEDRRDLLEWPGVIAAVPGEYLLSLVEIMEDVTPGFATRREVVGPALDELPFALRDPSRFPRYNAKWTTC